MRALHRFLTLLAFALVLATNAAVFAQAAPAATCPPKTLLSIARAGAACVNLEAGNACYGSGLAYSTGQPGSASPGLGKLGDRAALGDLSSVTVSQTGTDEVSIAALAIRTSPRASDVVNVLLIGDAELQSEVTPPVEQVMQPTGTLNLRAAPAEDAPIVATLGINSRVIANGRYGNWLRVVVPATGGTAWVAASLLSGDSSGLPSVEPGDPVLPPFAAVTMYIRQGAVSCGGSLYNGILMQTPSTDFQDAVLLNLTPSVLRLAGTAFYARVEDRYVLVVLDGVAESDGLIVPAGASTPVADDGSWAAVPYDPTLVANLPINNLPRRFTVAPPLAQAEIDTRIAELTAPPPTLVPTVAVPDNACRRSIGRLTTVWSGPGEDYETLGQLQPGTAIRPVLATTDTRGADWWQLSDSGWVARSNVVERGDCPDVPAVARVQAPPTNTYSMERCASNNGPVRAGQRVTFEFIPPAWDNLGEAQAATRTDPGHFTLNAQTYRAQVSQPFRLGTVTNALEDRYLRRFTLTWTAEPGTYRITGDWLHYEPSCNLTVAVE